MTTFKKLAIISGLIFSILLPFSSHADEKKTVYFAAIIEHPALDNVKKGVIDELAENGYVEGKNLEIRYQSAQGSMANLTQIAKLFVSQKPDVMVALATPTAQALAANTKDIPIVFTAVTDPVAAKLTPSWEPSKTNVTGVSDQLAMETQIEMIKKIKPDAKKVGFVYNPSEINSTIVLRQLNELLPQYGLELVPAAAAKTSDIPTAALSLKGRVDVIYSNTDNNVISGYESLVKVGNSYQIPLIASDPDSANRGATAALGMSYYHLGRQAGQIVIRILEGEKAGDIAPQVGNKTELALNKKAAKQQGVELSDEIIGMASTIIEE